MAPSNPPPAFPPEWPVPGGGPALVLRGDLVAVLGDAHGEPDARAVQLLDNGRIAVLPASAAPAEPSGRIGPVYADSGGGLAVPTGRLFVRFASGTDAAAKAADLERAGFVIEKVPHSARHTAWVSPRHGGVAAALRGARDLARLPGVENVEAQFLRESARR